MSELKQSFAPVVGAHTRVLILGSLPGERSLAAREYYVHPQNQFWRLAGKVIGRELQPLDYPDRLAALLDAGVGLWDVVATARRQGSSDAAMRDIATNDLSALIASLPSLRAIGFNGGASLTIGRRMLGDATPHVAQIALPSSSPLHTVGFNAKLPAWLALRPFLEPPAF